MTLYTPVFRKSYDTSALGAFVPRDQNQNGIRFGQMFQRFISSLWGTDRDNLMEMFTSIDAVYSSDIDTSALHEYLLLGIESYTPTINESEYFLIPAEASQELESKFVYVGEGKPKTRITY